MAEDHSAATLSMSGKVFVDTNILVYCFDNADPGKKKKAVDLMLELWTNGRGVLSLQVLKEFFVTVTRKLTPGMKYNDAHRAVKDFLSWEIAQEDAKSLLLAIDIFHRHRFSFWDANVIASATLSNCKVCLSEDMNDGQIYESVKIINPFLA